MNSPIPALWPGPMASRVTLPGANTAIAWLEKKPVSISGTDTIGYAQDVVNQWRGATAPATPAPASSGGITGAIADAAGSTLTKAALLALGLLVFGFGLYVIAKDA